MVGFASHNILVFLWGLMWKEAAILSSLFALMFGGWGMLKSVAINI